MNPVYPRGVGGEGGTYFAPYPEHSRKVSAEKNGSIPGLCAHFLHWLKGRFAAKGSGDPGWDRRVSFSRSDTSLRVGGVLDCKSGRGFPANGHVRVPIWECGSTGAPFWRRDCKTGGGLRSVLSHPSLERSEGWGTEVVFQNEGSATRDYWRTLGISSGAEARNLSMRRLRGSKDPRSLRNRGRNCCVSSRAR
jgi:hypothetical protein